MLIGRNDLIGENASSVQAPLSQSKADGSSGSGQPDNELSRTNDLVILDSGQRVTGSLLNAEITLRTAWGPLKLEKRWLAEIELPEGANGFASVLTVNSNWLTGFIEAPMLRFQPGGGTTIDVPRDKMRRLLVTVLKEGTKHPRPQSGSPVTNVNRVRDDGGAHASSPSSVLIEGMIWIPPGEFVMGSPTDESGRDIDEGPETKVVIPQGFWIAKCEVTQAEFRAVAGANPSINPEDPRLPVEKINWFEAMAYCAKLTIQAEALGRLPRGHAYRLPTEAEWEYACRAGTATRFSYGEDKAESQLGDYAWFVRNADSTAHPVGTRKPNPWGLFDMHGNVWEWCLDRWAGALPGGTITNNAAAAGGTLRVARGGSWLYEAKACRSANRDEYSPSNRCGDVGFRVVLAPLQP